MRIVRTDKVSPDALTGWEREQVYNGLDTTVTLEVFEMLHEQLNNLTANTYRFSLDLQAPVLDMRLRGVRVDESARWAYVEKLYERTDELEATLEEIVSKGLDFHGFNWRSNADLRYLFYDLLKIPPVLTKTGSETVNRGALERIKIYLWAKPFVNLIGEIREYTKKIQLLKTSIDDDGRFRTSYNIAGTDTGRFSSSLSEFGTGGNLQNIEEDLRRIFVADKGKKLAYLDAAQGESRVVGAIEWNLFHDGKYLDTCEGGDLHTDVAKLCWPKLRWTGDLGEDRHIAEQPYYRHYSRRFMCKKIGHGSNYGGKAKTLADQAKIDVEAVERFQEVYFPTFPAHRKWHEHVEREVRTKGELVSLMERRRQFWGRRDYPDTIREALAFDPQGSLSDIVNKGTMNVWRNKTAELLMNVHDAVVFQYPEEKEDEIIPKLRKQLEYEVRLKHGRSMIIPYDCKVGWNYGMMTKENPDGLKEYSQNDRRQRTEEMSFLDRPVRRVDSKS